MNVNMKLCCLLTISIFISSCGSNTSTGSTDRFDSNHIKADLIGHGVHVLGGPDLLDSMEEAQNSTVSITDKQELGDVTEVKILIDVTTNFGGSPNHYNGTSKLIYKKGPDGNYNLIKAGWLNE